MQPLSLLDERYQKDPSIVAREIAGEVLLVPIRQNVGDLESLYRLNETAARMWALVDGQRTVGEIRDAIVAEFDIGPEQAQQDVTEFVAQLETIGAVARV
ncbi:MAG: PqqD family protein [Chloroflexi bacterium]|nr:PqqD family protein [Chloroflexota bacterium]MBU1751362.1 PqqD family protein [Chloroflexota bacterium]